MTTVNVNGQPYVFPDNMSQDDIKAVLQKKFPKEAANDIAPEPVPQDTINPLEVLGRGAADTASFGLDPKIRGLGSAIGKSLAGDPRSFGDLYELGKNDIRSQQKEAQTQSPKTYLAGQITGAVAPSLFTPSTGLAAWAGRGGLGARTLKGASISAAPAGVYGANVSDGSLEDRAKSAASYAVPAAVLGGTLPVLGAGYKAVKGAVAPAVSEAGAEVAKLAQKYNINLGLDDLTDSKFYKTMISEGQSIPFSGSANKIDAQGKQFTRAVSKSIGADTDKITPEVISKRFDELGSEFDNFFKGKTIDLGKDYGLGLRQQDFIKNVSDNYATDGKNILDKYMGQINATIKKDGTIDGEALGAVRNRVSNIARNSKNPEIAGAARDVENFIIDTVSDVSDKGAKEAFRKTKYQYKNLIAIEPLASKDQIAGQISPAQLLGRVRQVYGRAFSKGDAGELGDLANIGQYIKESVPNSGTAQRTMARNILTGNAIGIAPTLYFGGPLAALAQAGVSGAAMLGNRVLQSRNFNPAAVESALKQLTAPAQKSITGSAVQSAVTKAPQILKEKK